MMIRSAILLTSAWLCFGTAALAQDSTPEAIGTFGDWQAYSYTGKDGKVCFVMSAPKDTKPDNVKRDPANFLVTHRPKQNVTSEISVIIGYTFKEGGPVVVEVEGQSFTLNPSGDGAWAQTAADDRKIVASLKKGTTMLVKGTSWRGTVTSDTYSLTGISAAMDKIDEACKP
ncbi:MAG: invasion associated locus B family protein [Aestuariivirgaceae bacterium]|nr:invasion associated locus B family protein [Aestuariivirgaceae bacterium]